MRILFMGTPVFACAILERLCQEGYTPVAVVSQPDKKTGRKQLLTPTPVKSCAMEHGIEVFQPENIKESAEWIRSLDLDLIITCAYGQFIPEAILNAPKHGSINVHASLLPKLRGGAPIHKAILYGEKETGVSIMRMVKKMDAGARDLVFVIGGPYGLSKEVYGRSSGLISMSRMTFSHQMARVIFTEQLYRACTIIRGMPYHHE